MSFQSYVTERLLAISEALNQINLRAKKIDDLPVQSTLDPSSKIHVSRNGESESLQIQKIIESVQVGTYNRLLSIDTITLSGNVVTIPALAQWVIDNVNYSNTANINITVPYCATGLSRKDILVANTLNQIVLIQGTETAGITIQPNLPPNTVYVTEMDVTDSSVGQPQPPEVNGAYVQKSERANVVLTGSGVINQLDLVDEKATIVFKDSITRLNTISYASVPYNGKRITLFNAQATPVTIGHSVSGYGVDFVFSDGQDYILAPNQTIEFSFDITYAPYAHHMFIGSKGIATWSELQGKPSTFPPSAHTHTISEVTGLQGVLDGKKNKTLAITTEATITRTLTATDECIVFTNANPVAFNIPTNASMPIPIGTEVQYTQQGDGIVTVGGAGITFVTNLALAMVKGETRKLTKIGTDTWTISGSVKENETLISFTKSNYWGLVNPNWYIGVDGTSLQITTDSGTQNLITALSGFCTRNNVAIAPYDMKLISIVCARRSASAAIIGVVKGTPTAEHTIGSVVSLYEGTSFSSNQSIIIDLDFNTQPIISKGQLVRFSVRHNQTGAANSSDTYTFTFKKV